MASVIQFCCAVIFAAMVTCVVANVPDCTNKADGTIVRRDDCLGYDQCESGNAVAHECTGGMVFSKANKNCVNPGSAHDDCNLNFTPPEICAGKPDGLVIPKQDCTGGYKCANGEGVELTACLYGTVFCKSEGACVTRGDIHDDCTLTVQQRCNVEGAVLIPYPGECQLYYDCSQTGTWKGEQYLAECEYPKQFNSVTSTCDDFKNVECGGRTEILDHCEYLANKCPYFMPCWCSIEYPSCSGLQDGLNVYKQKWGPDFVECNKGRLVRTGKCPDDEETHRFHPDQQKCVPLDMIPRENGGTMPNCSELQDGFHPDDQGRCNQYTVCDGEKVNATVKCYGGLVFDTATKSCRSIGQSCSPPPCGDPNNWWNNCFDEE